MPTENRRPVPDHRETLVGACSRDERRGYHGYCDCHAHMSPERFPIAACAYNSKVSAARLASLDRYGEGAPRRVPSQPVELDRAYDAFRKKLLEARDAKTAKLTLRKNHPVASTRSR